MTVKDLIDILETIDPQKQVFINFPVNKCGVPELETELDESMIKEGNYVCFDTLEYYEKEDWNKVAEICSDEPRRKSLAPEIAEKKARGFSFEECLREAARRTGCKKLTNNIYRIKPSDCFDYYYGLIGIAELCETIGCGESVKRQLYSLLKELNIVSNGRCNFVRDKEHEKEWPMYNKKDFDSDKAKEQSKIALIEFNMREDELINGI